ncbi:Dynein heavy chain 12 [Durusdinium trenchii]|uniref:Axonemal n=1 Tax=Durusdinium trenchii TaxID=1381693 RepID=A0ABP0QKF3_9DINO
MRKKEREGEVDRPGFVLGSSQGLLITFSCTTLWWLPYKVLSWAEDQQLADQLLLIPVVVAHRFNHLIKATSVAALSGLLWPCSAASTCKVDSRLDRAPTMSVTMGDSDLWTDKVHELANRGVTLTSLLRFWQALVQDKVMPSFDPRISTTNDVVRQAIIPLTRNAAGEGQAMASLWSCGQPVCAASMVTHNWSNYFHHLMAAIFADALEEEHYAGVAEMLLTAEGYQRLENKIQEKGCGNKSYWVCAFSVNQHACICDNFGRAPPEGTPEFEEWDLKRRDSVTGLVFNVCPCKQRKIWNNEPALCEMNKFDSMMRHLNRQQRDFSHLVVVDVAFDVFTRAWCIAEIVESGRSRIHQRIKLHSEAALDRNYQRLSSIDVRHCKASRPEDREMILQSIQDVKRFNSDLQWTIFGTEGLLRKWMDGRERAALAGRCVRRAGTFGGHFSSSSTLDPMDTV